MNQIVAVTFNKLLIGGFNILDSLLSAQGITEVVVFMNGVNEPEGIYEKYKHEFGKYGVGLTLMENETELELDKVIRHIVSYAHHNYSDGLLYILRGSDLVLTDKFLGALSTESDAILLKGDNVPNLSSIESIPDLFKLNTPFSFIPVFSLSNAQYALTSRNLREFLLYLIECSTKKGNSAVNVENSVTEVDSDAILLSGKYSVSLISEKDFKDTSTKKIIKLLLNNVK